MATRRLGGIATSSSVPDNGGDHSGGGQLEIGQEAFTGNGSYDFIVPSGVNKVSIVAVGKGADGEKVTNQVGKGNSGGGGALSYSNGVSVTPGETLSVVIHVESTSISRGGSVLVKAMAGNGTQGGKASEGIGDAKNSGGGGGGMQAAGGAAGYSGDGGSYGRAGQGGGGAGGGAQTQNGAAPSGGGVGILGEGASGTAPSSDAGGSGGSGGEDGGGVSGQSSMGPGGSFGGGGGGSRARYDYDTGVPGRAFGGNGALRIIWPGEARRFPSTYTKDDEMPPIPGASVYTDDVFSTYVYEGTGADQYIENGIDLAGEGGLVWIKMRDTSSNTARQSHFLYDTERGAGFRLSSDNEDEQPPFEDRELTGFNSDGFSLGSSARINESTKNHASWTFCKAPKFFDCVTYSGDNSTPTTVPHGLGIEPGMIIIKSTSDPGDWYVYHKGFTFPNWCALNSSDAQGTSKGAGLTAPPTAESFTVSNGSGVVGAEQDYVAYVFAHDDSDESMIKCGSFTASSTSGTQEIDLGWEPQFLLVKRADAPTAGYNWDMYDTMRGWVDVLGQGNVNRRLSANTSGAEVSDHTYQPCSTGFRFEAGWGPQEYIYMAIRRPNKPAEEFEPEELFAVNSMNSDGQFESGFPVDFALQRNSVSGPQDNWTMARLTQGKRTKINADAAEINEGNAFFDYQDRWYEGAGLNTDNMSWMWRRAPGYFDLTCHTSNGQPTQQINHSLGVIPEMAWIKSRSLSGTDWFVHHKDLTAGTNLRLNTHQPELTDNVGSPATFTESYWTPGNSGYASGGSSNNTYIAYLFASVPGISKVGSYTGTGQAGQEILIPDFTGWLRYLLIKRTDGTGSWWQTVTPGGYTSMIKLNDTAAKEKVTAIAPLSNGRGGFQLTTTDAEFNASNGEYIFYAIA